MIATRNWELNRYKPKKEKIYSKIATISIYKFDKLNAATMHL